MQISAEHSATHSGKKRERCITRRKCWLGRQESQPVFLGAKSLILLTQQTRFAPQMYSELAQFFKAKKLLLGVAPSLWVTWE